MYILYIYDPKMLVFKKKAHFFQELFCKIEKWTKKKCPKFKIAKKFLQKNVKKTILLERCRKK